MYSCFARGGNYPPLAFFLHRLLPGHSKQHKGRTGHEQDAAYGEQHGAVVAGLG